jgi:alpha-ketoglutarate-dependent taurine dioxygenase
MKIRYVDSIDEAAQYLHKEPVIAVRNVKFTSYQLTEFAATLGRIIKFPKHAIDAPRDPFTHLVGEDGYFSNYETIWHADGGYTDDGKVFTCLYNPSDDPDNRKDLPTSFSDMRQMPREITEQFRGWSVWYGLSFHGPASGGMRQFNRKIDTCFKRPIIQPDGSAYYNHSVASYVQLPGSDIVDLAIDSAQRTMIMERLAVFEQYAKANFTDHYWQPRDLLIYDNYKVHHARQVSIRKSDQLWRILTQYSKLNEPVDPKTDRL